MGVFGALVTLLWLFRERRNTPYHSRSSNRRWKFDGRATGRILVAEILPHGASARGVV